jgi:hypothetical protein
MGEGARLLPTDDRGEIRVRREGFLIFFSAMSAGECGAKAVFPKLGKWLENPSWAVWAWAWEGKRDCHGGAVEG